MVCVYCGKSTRVINSRRQKRTNQVWRRRQCPGCQAIFTTHEAVDLSSCLMFEGRSARLVPFSREKLFVSIYESCRHRQDAAADALALTDSCIVLLLDKMLGGKIERGTVIDAVASTLERFDKPAAVHYLAFHAQ